MDFAVLPPEVNSARMYSGPGSGPLLTAAAAWDRLSGELTTAAACYEGVLSELATGWTGPSAATMTAAAAPYLAWMHSTAALAEQTAGQSRGAAAAYESAFATTVPPPVIAANRSQLKSLVAANVFGQNTPAIAATEAAYGEMWAQDVTAMYGYAGESAGTTALAPFAPPPQATNPAGSGNQAAAVGQAAGASAGTQAQQAASSLAAMPAALQGMTTPGSAAAAESSSILGALLGGLPAAGSDPALAAAYTGLAASLFGAFVIDSAGSFGVDSAGSFGIDFIGLDVGALLAGSPQLINSVPGGLPAAGIAPVAAVLGQSTPLSGLSVPPAWTAKAPPPVQYVSASTALTATGAGAAPEVPAEESGMPFSDLAAASLAARAVAGIGRGRHGRGRPANRQHSPAHPSGPITKIAPELWQLAKLRDAGILTDAEFAEQKRMLLGH